MTELLSEVETILEKQEGNVDKQLAGICVLLNRKIKRFTWVGFYFMDHDNSRLRLGPYVGKPTDHEIIPFGRGICGQVAITGETYTADNVNEESNYIACSMDVRSEIVIPIYDREKLVAQMDIDSDELNAFSKDDRVMLEEVCTLIGNRLGPYMHYHHLFKD